MEGPIGTQGSANPGRETHGAVTFLFYRHDALQRCISS
jgi:hypothetical protein